MTKSATREAADEVSAPIASPSFTGNVGVGVTPEAWSSNNPALQIGSGGVLYSHVSNGTRVSLQGNAYVNSSNADAYITTNEASQHIQEDGTHLFKVAPSGTADSAISWTTGFEVLADGKARAKNGLLFGTDTAAANTLDDYETGTFIPTVRGSTNAGSFSTNTAHEGLYTKIGNVCTVNFRIAGTLSGATGSYTHFDLPFTVKAGSFAIGSFSYVDTPNLSHLDFNSYVNSGQTLGYFIIKTVSATTPVYPAPSSFMPSSVQLYGTVTYTVA